MTHFKFNSRQTCVWQAPVPAPPRAVSSACTQTRFLGGREGQRLVAGLALHQSLELSLRPPPAQRARGGGASASCHPHWGCNCGGASPAETLPRATTVPLSLGRFLPPRAG